MSSYEQDKAAPELLSMAEYLDARTRLAAYGAWAEQFKGRNGWTCIPADKVAEATIAMRNDDRSAIERFEFCIAPPASYFLYIALPEGATVERARVMGASGLATTWTGERLGRVTFGRPYHDNFGGKRVPVWIDAINGRCYHGTYFQSAGDYARVKLTKAA